MEFVATCRVRLYDESGRISFKANKGQSVPKWVLDKDPALAAKCDAVGVPPLPEPQPTEGQPSASQPTAAVDDGPAVPVPVVPSPSRPEPKPVRRGRPKGSKNKS